MTKKVIGIVPKANSLFTTDFYNDDIYAFVNNYGKRITEAGGLPIGLVPIDAGENASGIEEQLDMCHALLFSGGGRIWPYHIRAIHYAYKRGIKVLGICMGMQVMHTYFILRDEAQRRGLTDASADELLEIYDEMKKARYYFVEPVSHHWDIDPTASHMQDAKHLVYVKCQSNTSKVMGLEPFDKINAVTMHRYRVINPSKDLAVTMMADDDTIEGIEYGDVFIGVQFHPEAETEFMELFKWLCA